MSKISLQYPVNYSLHYTHRRIRDHNLNL